MNKQFEPDWLREISPEWVIYVQQQVDAVNRREQTVDAGVRNCMSFAVRAICDLLAKECVRLFTSHLLYLERRHIVRLLNRHIRQIGSL